MDTDKLQNARLVLLVILDFWLLLRLINERFLVERVKAEESADSDS